MCKVGQRSKALTFLKAVLHVPNVVAEDRPVLHQLRHDHDNAVAKVGTPMLLKDERVCLGNR